MSPDWIRDLRRNRSEERARSKCVGRGVQLQKTVSVDLVHWDYWGVIGNNEWLGLSIFKSEILKSRCLWDESLHDDLLGHIGAICISWFIVLCMKKPLCRIRSSHPST